MYNTKDMIVFNPGQERPEENPPGGRLGLFVDENDQLAVIGGGGNVHPVLPYKSIIALISQVATSAPAVTILHNDTGRTFTSVRVGAGDYELRVDTGDPLPSQTTMIVTNGSPLIAKDAVAYAYYDIGNIAIETATGGVNTDTLLNNATIELKVFE